MPKSLDHRIGDLEAMQPSTDETVGVIHIVGLAPGGDASEPRPITRASFGGGDPFVRADSETEAAFLARVRASRPPRANGCPAIILAS